MYIYVLTALCTNSEHPSSPSNCPFLQRSSATYPSLAKLRPAVINTEKSKDTTCGTSSHTTCLWKGNSKATALEVAHSDSYQTNCSGSRSPITPRPLGQPSSSVWDGYRGSWPRARCRRWCFSSKQKLSQVHNLGGIALECHPPTRITKDQHVAVTPERWPTLKDDSRRRGGRWLTIGH